MSARITLTAESAQILYVCPNRMDSGIHLDHSYLGTLEKVLNSTLIAIPCQTLNAVRSCQKYGKG